MLRIAGKSCQVWGRTRRRLPCCIEPKLKRETKLDPSKPPATTAYFRMPDSLGPIIYPARLLFSGHTSGPRRPGCKLPGAVWFAHPL
jgi:hypothetical protein